MTENGGSKDLEELRNIEDAVVDRLLELPEAELLAEMAEDGIDLEADATRIGALSKSAAGKARMAAAKASVVVHGVRFGQRSPASQRPVQDIRDAKGLTMAARNGSSQSEADINSVADDLVLLKKLEEEGGGE